MNYSKTYYDDLEKIFSTIDNIEELKNSKVLITGSTGLIGSAIIDFLMFLNLKKEYNITIYATGRSLERFNNRFKIYNNIESLKFVNYDVTKKINFNLVFDYVIYAAGLANPNEYNMHPVETMNSSYVGLNNILQYGIKNKYKKMLYISSSEIYGMNNSVKCFKEEDYGIINPNYFRSCYPASKKACETLCEAYLKEYGIEYSIVRPGHIYGPTMIDNDNRVASLFLKLAKQNKNIILKSSGKQKRSFCYVLDVVSAIIIVLLKGECTAYNISNNNSNISIKEFAEIISNISKVKITYEVPTEIEKSSFNSMDNSLLDNSKITKLGWSSIFDLKKGILHTLEEISY